MFPLGRWNEVKKRYLPAVYPDTHTITPLHRLLSQNKMILLLNTRVAYVNEKKEVPGMLFSV